MSRELTPELQALCERPLGPEDLPTGPADWPYERAHYALNRIDWQLTNLLADGCPTPAPTPSEIIDEGVKAANNLRRIQDPLLAACLAEEEVGIRAAFAQYRALHPEETQVDDQLLARRRERYVNRNMALTSPVLMKYIGEHQNLPGFTAMLNNYVARHAQAAHEETLTFLEQTTLF